MRAGRLGKPLTVDMIPEHLRAAFDIASRQPIKHSDRRGFTIKRTCLRCGQVKAVLESNIKQSIKTGTISGMCLKCSSRAQGKKFRFRKGPLHHRWKGRRKTPLGYVLVYQPDDPRSYGGYVMEHRMVMESCLGRLLVPHETIHHKNGIRDDNRIENLELWSSVHPNGTRYNDLSDSQIQDVINFLHGILESRQEQELLDDYSNRY
jgi:Zn finger protein HypA/HybF involved in hydrogenase expression